MDHDGFQFCGQLPVRDLVFLCFAEPGQRNMADGNRQLLIILKVCDPYITISLSSPLLLDCVNNALPTANFTNRLNQKFNLLSQ